MIHVLYFSPTASTFRVLQALVAALPPQPAKWQSYTLPVERLEAPVFEPDDILVWGSPVYAGKLPNKLLPWLREHLRGCGNPAVLLCTFGNRGFDHALAEMRMLALEGGFRPVAAAAMVSPHAFDGAIGGGRPSEGDLAELRRFAAGIRFADAPPVELPGDAAAPYYQPLRDDLMPAVFLRAAPQFDAARCVRCGACVASCPMGSLALSDSGVPESRGVCIKCMACVSRCEHKAVGILRADFQAHIRMLRQHCREPRKNAFYLNSE